ncbi:MAG: PhzF family phenazine biosynthesis protein [Gallionellaceae bacterium]
MMNIPIYQVDAFTQQVFHGNPAAVCILESWPQDSLLQSIAMENNLSETAFLLKQGKYSALRWFTPQVEMDLCGHATLAAAHVIFNFIEPQLRKIAFTTLSGILTVTRKDDLLHMDFPAHPAQPCACPTDLLRGLGKHPVETHLAEAYLAVFDHKEDILALQPDAEFLKRLDLPYVIVTAKSSRVDFVSRVFGPKVGIAEDPETGAAHCILVPYWAKKLCKKTFHAQQVSKRGGDLYCELKGERVEIAGHAAHVFQG